MRYIDEFRNKQVINRVSQRIFKIMPKTKISIMEVCGTHTQSFHRFGLDKLVPDNLGLIAGPGCPVCVSDQDYIDRAIQLSKSRQVIILTFSDMLRVPGRGLSLQKQRAQGGDIRIIYSAWDSLEVARHNPGRKVILLAVGFETTAPTFALTLLEAKRAKLNNLFCFPALKLIPPAMEALVLDREVKIKGFLCPGHVSTIIGSQAYEFIARKYRVSCCVTGFEPLDILEGIYLLLYQIKQNKARVDNQYIRAVNKQGNKKAKAIINRVFKISDAIWRGIGRIPRSGLELTDEFSSFDVQKTKSLSRLYSRHYLNRTGNLSDSIDRGKRSQTLNRCRCKEVLKGIIQPTDCALFKKACSPINPYGPCMVSNEGACNVFYKYRR